MKLEFVPRRIVILLATCVVALTIISGLMLYSRFVLGHERLLGVVDLFNTGIDANLPTWWSSVLLLACSGLLGVIARAHTERVDGSPLAWRALATVFFFLSIDEVAMIHERIGDTVGDELLHRAGVREQYSNRPWIVVYLPLMVLGGACFWRFFGRLPRRTRLIFAAAAVVFVGGAVGVEAIAHAVYSSLGEATYWAITMIEEFLEMIGVVLFIGGLLDYIAIHLGGLSLELRIGARSLAGASRSWKPRTSWPVAVAPEDRSASGIDGGVERSDVEGGH